MQVEEFLPDDPVIRGACVLDYVNPTMLQSNGIVMRNPPEYRVI